MLLFHVFFWWWSFFKKFHISIIYFYQLLLLHTHDTTLREKKRRNDVLLLHITLIRWLCHFRCISLVVLHKYNNIAVKKMLFIYGKQTQTFFVFSQQFFSTVFVKVENIFSFKLNEPLSNAYTYFGFFWKWIEQLMVRLVRKLNSPESEHSS